MKRDDSNLIQLGVCTKPHGIKGGFSLQLENLEESVLKEISEITIFPRDNRSSVDPDGMNVEITKISFGNKAIAYFKGMDDRTLAENMVPFDIYVPRNEFPEVSDGEFYVADLIGMTAFCHTTGDEIGEIKDLYDNGMQTVFVISTKNGDMDLPFVDNFFPVVDLDSKRVEIVVPEVIGAK